MSVALVGNLHLILLTDHAKEGGTWPNQAYTMRTSKWPQASASVRRSAKYQDIVLGPWGLLSVVGAFSIHEQQVQRTSALFVPSWVQRRNLMDAYFISGDWNHVSADQSAFTGKKMRVA